MTIQWLADKMHVRERLYHSFKGGTRPQWWRGATSWNRVHLYIYTCNVCGLFLDQYKDRIDERGDILKVEKGLRLQERIRRVVFLGDVMHVHCASKYCVVRDLTTYECALCDVIHIGNR